MPPPLSVIHFTLDRLLDSNDKTRRSSVLVMISIFRSIKPARKRIRIRPCHSLAGEPLPSPKTIGIREDNQWIIFSESRVPKTPEEYDSMLFIDKLWMGYFGWPKNGLDVSAPIGQQSELDKINRKITEYTELRKKSSKITLVQIFVDTHTPVMIPFFALRALHWHALKMLCSQKLFSPKCARAIFLLCLVV